MTGVPILLATLSDIHEGLDRVLVVGNGLAVWQILNDKQSKHLRRQLAKLGK